jgi:predicted transcriptional regulator
MGRKLDLSNDLSRRERQIMDAVYRLGKATAAEIREAIPDPPTYTAIRTHLGILHEKGHVRYESDGARYVYEPVVPKDEMGKSAIDGVLRTFFEGSVERVVATLLDRDETQLTPEQLDRLAEIIEQARREGR